MAGHALLNQVSEIRDAINIDGEVYYIQLSWYRLTDVPGYVVGLKFTDSSGSMDAAKIGHTNPYTLAKAIGNKAMQILKNYLEEVSIFGFYLLTDDLEERRPGGVEPKRRIYNAQAIRIHRRVKYKLQYLTSFQVQGGVGWVMSEKPADGYEQFHIFENELAKNVRITHHVD